MEHVLANLNALNRSLEGVNSVGKEFESVGELWSNFYDGVKDPRPTSESGENQHKTN
jgi:DASH complex subunit DAD1